MKILSFLNVSNLQRITCDSGFNFQRLVAHEFIRAGHKFTFASPVPIAGLQHSHYRYILLSFGQHKYEVRFTFPWRRIEEAILLEEPDIIWVNQPELAPAFRALLSSIRSSASLITYLHYFPYEICAQGNLTFDPSLDLHEHSLSIPLAFLNGVVSSDLVLVHSTFAYKLLLKGLQSFSLTLARGSSVAVVPPPFDPSLIPDSTTRFQDRTSIVYNHRLYTQYGTQTIIDYLKRGVYTNNHNIVVMDILGQRSPERKKLDPSVEQFRADLKLIPSVVFDEGGDDRNYYKHVLARTKFGVAPFRSCCPWSMSVIDCLAAGLPVLAENQAFFSEVVPQECLHDGSYEQFSFIWRKLACDKIFWRSCSDAGRNMIAHLTPENVTAHLCNLFNNARNMKRTNSLVEGSLPVRILAEK